MRDQITSLKNSEIKKVLKLRKARNRDKDNLIIVEGKEEVAAALKAGMEVKEVFFSLKYAGQKGKDFLKKKLKVIEVTDKVFKKISYRDRPDGFLALVRPKYFSLANIKLGHHPLVVVLEKVEKPGNLGAVLRTANAVSADAVIVADQQTDIYNPNVIRASRGAVFTLPTVTVDSPEALNWLKKNKIKVVAASPEAKRSYTEINYKISMALAIGAEHEGLSQKWLKAADALVKIPMAGKIDSLNASVSAAIILYEAVRQRGLK
ncbi:MAG: RNA methyltransferase [Patescibacteria group bacterium]